MQEKICIVASSALTVNAFLLEPILLLSLHYQVFIVVNDSPDSISDRLKHVTVLTVPIERKISPLNDLAALWKLVKIFKKHDFDVVQSVTPKAGLLAMLASFLARVRVRIHIFTGQVWVTKGGISRFFLKMMDRLIALSATGILIDSDSQRQFLLNESVVSPAKSFVLANGSISGVDTVRFKPDEAARLRQRQELEFKEEDVVFLFIGRLNRDKGVLDLATAFSKIESPRARLLVVGPDEAEMRSKMTQILASNIGKVTFVGFSSVPEEYMAAADVLCLPSYREGFGSVVIEAAAVGIPTIGSNIYGIKDAVEDSKSGLLFQVGNIDELFQRMVRLVDDKSLRKKLGNYARERSVKDFSNEYVASEWLEYYREKI